MDFEQGPDFTFMDSVETSEIYLSFDTYYHTGTLVSSISSKISSLSIISFSSKLKLDPSIKPHKWWF